LKQISLLELSGLIRVEDTSGMDTMHGGFCHSRVDAGAMGSLCSSMVPCGSMPEAGGAGKASAHSETTIPPDVAEFCSSRGSTSGFLRGFRPRVLGASS
jgi:hypothetical protein